MAEQQEQSPEVEPSEQEMDEMAMQVAQAISARLADELTNCPPDPATIRARILEVLGGDAGAQALIAAAYSEGYEDCARERVEGTAPHGDPRWADVQSLGERKALHREQHLCNQCTLAPMCVLARNTPPEAMALVRRCLHFTPRPGAR